MAATIVNGYIDEWIWRRLVHKIYRYEDAQYLCSQLIGQVHLKMSTPGKENQFTKFMHLTQQNQQKLKLLNQKKIMHKKLTRDEETVLKRQQSNLQAKLLFQQEFLKVILDFQLQEHEKYLHEFTRLFKEIDTNNDGIVTED